MTRVRIGLIVLVALLLPVVIGASHAQDAPYAGLDVLFLVDQSGSMGGADFDYPEREATDPLALRFEAVQYVLDTLGEYRLQIAPDLSFRMAVINFGDNPVVTLNWTPIADPPADWSTTRQQLLDQLSADTFRAENDPANLGNTNFLAAFEAAQTMFAALPSSGTGQRLRVIILLTDGEPCVVSGPYQFQCGSPLGQQDHMNRVLELAQDVFPAPDYLLYVLALDATGDLWTERQADWEAIAGDPNRASRVETNQEIGVKFFEILAQLVSRTISDPTTIVDPPQKLVPGVNAIVVPPYQRQMRLSIFKSSTSPGVLQVTQPDGTGMPPGDPDLTISNQDRPIEIWTITYPQPGEWVFDVGSTQDRIDVYLELIPLDVGVEVTSGQFIQYDPMTLTARFTDASTGQPLPIYPAPYTLEVTTTLTLPDGSTEILSMPPTTQGFYEASYTPQLGGQYTVGIVARTMLPSGGTNILYENPSQSTFQVGDIALQVDGIPTGDQLVGAIVPVSAQLLDTTGQPVSYPDQQFNVVLLDDNGVVKGNAMTDPDGDGVYTAEIALDQDGAYRLRVTVEGMDGTQYDQVLSSYFTVLPSDMISLRLVEPLDGTEQFVQEGLPPLNTSDLEIVFETRLDQDNSLIDVRSLAEDATNPVLRVMLVTDGKAEPLTFEMGDQPGQYRTVVSDLDEGTYTVNITATGPLQQRYVLNPDSSSASTTIERVTNPALFAFYILVAAVVVFVVVVAVLLVLRRRRRRQHPARGSLVITELDMMENLETEIWRVNLDRYNSNTITLKRRDLPRKAPITNLIIRCDNDRMSSQRHVRITAKNEKATVLQDQILTPGRTLTLREQSDYTFGDAVTPESMLYQIVKDPDDFGFGGTSDFTF